MRDGDQSIQSTHRDWAEPDRSILGRAVPIAPDMPRDLFGRFAEILEQIAVSHDTSFDYAGASFLGVIGSLIGGKRCVSPRGQATWREFPIIWIALIGLSGVTKSPALRTILRAIKAIERDLAIAYRKELAAWRARTAADGGEKQDRAKHEGEKEPNRTPELEGPGHHDRKEMEAKPVRLRLTTSDITPEAACEVLKENPAGIMHASDELTSIFGGFDRYNNRDGRSFYLQAYSGDPYIADRKGSEEPIDVPFLGISMLGSIQPGKFAPILAKDPDDGLLARLLYVYPTPCDPHQFGFADPDLDVLKAAYRRLVDLPWGNGGGSREPVDLALSIPASEVFELWRKGHMASARNASGFYASFANKMPGLVLRLSLIAEFLQYAWDGLDEPTNVSLESVCAAIRFVDEFALPTATKVFHDQDGSPDVRPTTILARYIAAQRFDKINLRNLKSSPHKAALKDLQFGDTMKRAAEELCGLGWLREAGRREGTSAGRRSSDYEVNPRIFAR